MSEFLDMAKTKAGLNNKKPTEETKKDDTLTLEDAINQVDNIEARELLRAKTREMKAQYELRAREAETRLREQGDKIVTNEKTTEEKPKRWSVVNGKPIEDSDGEYETFAQAYKVGALEAAKASDPTAFFKFLKSEGLLAKPKEGSDFTQDLAKRYLDNIDAQLKGSNKAPDEVKTLRDEINSLSQEVRRMSDPVEIISRAKALTEGLRDAGLIPTPSAGGTSIEELHEKYRHEEKMEEIKGDKDYKEKIINIASDIPEKVGRGLAGQFLEESREESSSSGELRFLTCTEEGCGHKIYITPDTGNIVTCGKCGMVYNRGKQVETKTE